MAAKNLRIFETRYFGLIIGILLFGAFVFLDYSTDIFSNLEQRMLDIHFKYKNLYEKQNVQEGVTAQYKNPSITDDILILGIDFNSLTQFGKWPFPRYREAHLLDSFSRIQYQNERESAVFLDLFFIEPDDNGYDDVMLINSMLENGRVFLETVLDENEPSGDVYNEFFDRQQILYNQYGKITNISGDWEKVQNFYGVQAPLKPYAAAAEGYGHANFRQDIDDVYRRQPMILRSSRLLETMSFESLYAGYELDREAYQRLEWVDKNDVSHSVDYPITESVLRKLQRELESSAPVKEVDLDGDGVSDSQYYVIRKYQDSFVPAITLSLALNHMNKELEDIEIVLGEYIHIESPQYFSVEENSWGPYRILTEAAVISEDGTIIKEAEYRILEEIRIPIDDQGKMLINYMGIPSTADPQGHQTFPVRSFAAYASNPPTIDSSKWPRTKRVGNKILMVGAFARGIAEDEKLTPYGLMYGVEIHANALNTILMNKFIYNVPLWQDRLILLGLIMFIAFITSRLKTIISLVIAMISVIVYFLVTSMVFENQALLMNFSLPAVSMIFTFITIVVYRVMTEERDKKRIRIMFGKYVSPGVVDHLLDNPPELGGVDKQLSVFFSDVRGFTTLSESMTPQELLNHLNVYFTKMTDIILSYNGTLDKYVGDEIMCFWGAPLPQEDHALLACRCALEQSAALKELNENWPEEKRINIGIGINSGIMTVGNVGSEGRMNYTLMGDPVNLGARLEGTNKQYGTQIIISEFTYGLVKDSVIVRELDNIRVKGKNKPVVIYELVDCR